MVNFECVEKKKLLKNWKIAPRKVAFLRIWNLPELPKVQRAPGVDPEGGTGNEGGARRQKEADSRRDL